MGAGGEERAWLRALGWVERNRDQFALAPYTPEPEMVARLKALGELARTADLLCRAGGLPREIRRRARALLEWSWQQFGRGKVFARLLDARPHAVALGTVYAIFPRHGCADPAVHSRLALLPRPAGSGHAASLRPLGDRELLAEYGRDGVFVLGLALAQAWRALELASPWSVERLFARTLLASCPDRPSLAVGDAYSVTHAVFFTTDWGDQPDGLEAACRDHLKRQAPGWMDHFRRAGDLDLYAQLALALACIQVRDYGLQVEAALRQAQAADGMIPGPERLAPRGAGDPARMAFQRHYHTTLVGLMASFAADAGLGWSSAESAPEPA
jgi:hypothetical protein